MDYWRGAWEAASGLPSAVAASASLREVRLWRACVGGRRRRVVVVASAAAQLWILLCCTHPSLLYTQTRRSRSYQ